MRKTKHFAAVIGAAGIMVGPFVTTVAAHADDSGVMDEAAMAVEAEGITAGIDVNEELAPTAVAKSSSGVASSASLGILIVNDSIVPFEALPDDVVAQLPDSGAITEAEYASALAAIAPYAVVDDDSILAAQVLSAGDNEVMVSLPEFAGEYMWMVNAPVVEDVAPPEDVVDVADEPTIPEAIADGGAEAPGAAAEASAPAADVSAPASVEGAEEQADAAVTPVTVRPTLPETGTDTLARPTLPRTGVAPFGAILAAAGLMSSGAGMITIRKRIDEE